jgi:hypothetical protein
MSAIITDQLRILNATNFVSVANSTDKSLYAFIGLPNPTDYKSDWDFSPPVPKDSFEQENDYWDTMIALKKITSGDVRQVIRKVQWTSGDTYDMYRHDISRTNVAQPSGSTSLYGANYYVLTQDYRIYVCLQNGTNPENPQGRPSLDEPTFTDLEPKSAGTSNDGYIWKYLYTVKPADIIKFDAVEFIPVPLNWTRNTENAEVRDNAATSGQIKIVTIKNRGIALGAPNRTYTNVPIKGDGTGAECTIVVNNDSKVDSITVSNGGSGYTHGRIDLIGGGVPTGSTTPLFDVIIPPKGGHGANIYRELGAYYVSLYARIENDAQNPDFIVGNQVARVGIVEDPQAYNSSTVLTVDKASCLYAVKLIGAGYSSAIFLPDSRITQTIGIGSTAVGRVVSYDTNTGVLKYWQDKSLVGFNSDGSQNATPAYGLYMNRFTATPDIGGSINVFGGNVTLGIDTSYSGFSTVINNRTYYLGQSFTQGISYPEAKKYSGNIIYVDHRPAITRSANQKEDIKVILQF